MLATQVLSAINLPATKPAASGTGRRDDFSVFKRPETSKYPRFYYLKYTHPHYYLKHCERVLFKIR